MTPIGAFRIRHITGARHDPMKDLTYLSSMVGFNYYVVVNAKSPWKSIDELVVEGKKKISLSLQYMDHKTYTACARSLYQGEAQSLKKLAVTVN